LFFHTHFPFQYVLFKTSFFSFLFVFFIIFSHSFSFSSMSCLKRQESEETLDISGPISDGAAADVAPEADFALVMRNWGERGITAKQLNVKKGDVIKVIERYPIGLWLGEMNGERGIFDSKCTVGCGEDGTPLAPINEADWVEEEAETPEERKARLERERQEKVQKLMKMMQDHDQAPEANNNNNNAPNSNAAPHKEIDSNEGESDSD
jgi:hypothetical protein